MEKKREFKSFNQQAFEYDVENSKDIVKEYCYYSEKGDGYLIYMKGHMYSQDEIDAGKILANNGFRVILTPEGNIQFASTINKRTGQAIFLDGYINSASYEQKTTTNPINKVMNIKRVLEHARKKRAQIAVLYDKNEVLSLSDINEGIIEFKKFNTYNFLDFLILRKDGYRSLKI